MRGAQGAQGDRVQKNRGTGGQGAALTSPVCVASWSPRCCGEAPWNRETGDRGGTVEDVLSAADSNSVPLECGAMPGTKGTAPRSAGVGSERNSEAGSPTNPF